MQADAATVIQSNCRRFIVAGRWAAATKRVLDSKLAGGPARGSGAHLSNPLAFLEDDVRSPPKQISAKSNVSSQRRAARLSFHLAPCASLCALPSYLRVQRGGRVTGLVS